MYTMHCLGTGFGCARTVLTSCLTDAVIKGVKTFRHYLNTVILKAQQCLAPIHCIKEFDKQCRSNIDTRHMVNEIMSDKVYAICLNDTTIFVK